MATANTCSKCGAPLGADARQGFCPKCLFAQLVDETGLPGLETASTGVNPHALSGSPEALESATDPAAAPNRQFGDYELLEALGRGGSGLVFKARQRSIGRHVALKLLVFGPLASPEVVKRFRMEATAAGALQHPNIVAIHEVGIHQDQHYLVMDYIAGPNLAAVATNQPWPASKAASLVKTLAEAIQYAHERGILHRDLKPSNILIDTQGAPHITDFGLAKRIGVLRFDGPPPEVSGAPGLAGNSPAEAGTPSATAAWFEFAESLTLTGQVLGSPNYMPPEQAAAKRGNVGAWSDVYSLGAILYHLLTGRPPFVGETITSTLHQVLETEAASPRLLNPRVPVDLETICLRCLEKEPQRRYPTARELGEELTRFVKGEPIRARPLRWFQRLWRWCRRNPVVASLTLVTFVLILTIAIGSLIAVFRIDHERNQVELQRMRAEQERQRAVQSEAEARTQLYAANMNLTQQAWEQNNIVRMKQLLEETKDYPDRGFEWSYWQTQLKQERKTFLIPGTTDDRPMIEMVAFSPDGQSILAWAGNSSIRLWDVTSGREKLAVRGAKPAFSPNSKQLVFGNHDGTAVLWDLESGKGIMRLIGHAGWVREVSVTPDGREVATWADDKTIRIWDARNGRERLRIQYDPGMFPSLHYSPDGRELIAAGANQAVRIWETERGQELSVFAGQNGPGFRNAVFSPDGRFVLALSHNDHATRVWERSTGKERLVLSGGPGELVRSAVFSPDGKQILTGSMDQTARLWDFSTGRELRTFKGPEHWVLSVAYSPLGDLIATGDRNGEVKLWSVRGGGESSLFHRHSHLVKTAFFSRDGKRMVTASHDHTVRIWDVDRAKEDFTFTRHATVAQAAVFSPDGQKVLSVGRDGTALLWRSTTGELIGQFKGDEVGDIASPIAFSHDGNRVAVGSMPAAGPTFARVWNAVDGTLITTMSPSGGGFCAVAFSPDDRFLASANSDWVARLWDASTGEQLRLFSGHRNWVRSVAFSSDGKRLVTASEDRSVRVWDVASGKELLTLKGHKDHIYWAEFSPVANRILSAGRDSTAILWDSISGRPLLTLKGHSNAVYSATFSRDGRRIATAGHDGTARIWEAPEPLIRRR